MKRQISAVSSLFTRLVRDEQGGQTLDTAMTLGFTTLGGYALVQSVGDKVLAMWQRLDAALGAVG